MATGEVYDWRAYPSGRGRGYIREDKPPDIAYDVPIYAFQWNVQGGKPLYNGQRVQYERYYHPSARVWIATNIRSWSV